MKCPHCGTSMRVHSTGQGVRDLPDDWTAQGGARSNNQYTTRRRHCPKCEMRLTTVEVEYVPGAQEAYKGVTLPIVPRVLPRRRGPVEGT